jgi:hypothetical protein
MTLEVLIPGVVSPEPGEQTGRVEVETKDCRERFGAGTNIWVQKETDRGETDVVSYSEVRLEGDDWKTQTRKDGKIEFTYTLKRGDQAARDPIDVTIIGRGQKNMPQVVFITAKTLQIDVAPEQARVASGDKTRVLVRLTSAS